MILKIKRSIELLTWQTVYFPIHNMNRKRHVLVICL